MLPGGSVYENALPPPASLTLQLTDYYFSYWELLTQASVNTSP